jgi:hypothetical protein
MIHVFKYFNVVLHTSFGKNTSDQDVSELLFFSSFYFYFYLFGFMCGFGVGGGVGTE